MLCKNCNGSLIVVDGICICESCGSKTPLDSFFENVDVFICYTESDDNGRRTKDSIISQDIYQKFQSKKIDTFYARISADGIAGDDYEKICFAALTKAKIVVVLGTAKTYFEQLYNKYNTFFENKIVVPVFSDIDASQMPKNISKIQALNYDTIGSEITLINSILTALGREAEINQRELFDQKRNKKLLIVILCCLGILIGIGCYIVFGTDLIIKPNDTTDVSSIEESSAPVDTRPTDYNTAIEHKENENYSDAIILLSNLSGYKDSDKQLQLLYDKYAGYYESNDGAFLFHLITNKNYSTSIELSCLSSNGKIDITETSIFSSNSALFEFTDSEGNSGEVTLILENQSITVKIKTKDKKSDFYISDQDVTFMLTDKSDKPINSIDAQTILSWLETPTSIQDLEKAGYKINVEYESLRMTLYNIYGIDNTDIKLNTIYGGVITSIHVPADLMIPEYIGQEHTYFNTSDNIVIRTDGYGDSTFIPSYYYENGDVIKSDTMILLVSKKSLEQALIDSGFDDMSSDLIETYFGKDTTNDNTSDENTESDETLESNESDGFEESNSSDDDSTPPDEYEEQLY